MFRISIRCRSDKRHLTYKHVGNRGRAAWPIAGRPNGLVRGPIEDTLPTTRRAPPYYTGAFSGVSEKLLDGNGAGRSKITRMRADRQ
ncbi:MAG: hypothetical protein JWN13_6102 [Betaproteobacteria bacterium]|jgi:hypothetical protein|nr:hypothetical protein [Betaproteobacteria bacterium]